ncbi:hypothetical protein K439DRAFT_368815 [Ramaria rubella]|nr:hypothetical protein K439DRAFT_368815 [Ramaria rubella]
MRPMSSAASIDISPHRWSHTLFNVSIHDSTLFLSSHPWMDICVPMVTPDPGHARRPVTNHQSTIVRTRRPPPCPLPCSYFPLLSLPSALLLVPSYIWNQPLPFYEPMYAHIVVFGTSYQVYARD